MTVGGMGFIPERLLMMMMMMRACVRACVCVCVCVCAGVGRMPAQPAPNSIYCKHPVIGRTASRFGAR